jgi:signal peptide peptidase SppA
MFQAANAIKSARKQKPVWAAVDDIALSAAYMLASAAERIYVPRETGKAGSIGVIAQRVDLTGADKKAGIEFNFIQAGKKKAFGNPHTPMSQSEEKEIQAEVDRVYGLFVDSVSRNRPKLSAEAIRATEAGIYTGPDAIEAKLADKLGTLDEAIADLNSSIQNKAVSSMTASAAMTSTKEAPVESQETNQATAPKAADSTQATASETTAQPAVAPPAAAPAAAAQPNKDDAYGAVAVGIVDLCAVAGQPNRASEFILKRNTLAEVRDALISGRAQAQESTQIQGRTMPNTGTNAQPSIEDNPVVKACAAIAAAAKGAK